MTDETRAQQKRVEEAMRVLLDDSEHNSRYQARDMFGEIAACIVVAREPCCAIVLSTWFDDQQHTGDPIEDRTYNVVPAAEGESDVEN